MQRAERLDLGQALYNEAGRGRLTNQQQEPVNVCVCVCVCVCPRLEILLGFPHTSFKSGKTTVTHTHTHTHTTIPTAVSLQRLIIKINSIKGCNCCSETQMLSQTGLKEGKPHRCTDPPSVCVCVCSYLTKEILIACFKLTSLTPLFSPSWWRCLSILIYPGAGEGRL